MINHVIKEKKWTKWETLKVSNECIRLYSESIIDPKDLKHTDILREALEILPKERHREVYYLAGRTKLSKKHILGLLKHKNRPSLGRPRKISDPISELISESVSDNALQLRIQELITQRVNKELDLIFSPQLKTLVEDSIFKAVDRFEKSLIEQVNTTRELTGLVTGSFSGTFKSEPVKKLQQLPLNPPIIIAPPKIEVTKVEEVKRVIIEDDHTVLPPIEPCKNDLLHIAIVGIMKKDHDFIKNKIDIINRKIEPHFFLSDPNHLKVPRIQAGMDHVFISVIEGADHGVTARLLANGYMGKKDSFTVQRKGGKSILVNLIIDWSINERRRREGIEV